MLTTSERSFSREIQAGEFLASVYIPTALAVSHSKRKNEFNFRPDRTL